MAPDGHGDGTGGDSTHVCSVAGGADPIYRQDVSGCLDANIGAGGLSSKQFAHWLSKADTALARLRSTHVAGALPLVADDDAEDRIRSVEAAYERLSDGAATIVFFGCGGASFGAQAIAQFGGWGIPGTTSAEQRRRPATRFYDNLDAETLAGLFGARDLGRFRFVIVSASGNTQATLTQAMTALAAVRDAGLSERIPDLFLGVTSQAPAGGHNSLRALCSHHRIPILDLASGLGGGFDALSNAGLLAAVARGLDARALVGGARTVVGELARSQQARDLPAAIGAALSVGLASDADVRVQVMMPYADRLMRLADWYARLWAESVGKDGKGMTPLACTGPVDHYGPLQLLVNGPRAHLVTVVGAESGAMGPIVPADLAGQAGLSEIAGRSTGDLVSAQGRTAVDMLRAAGRPVRTIDVVRYDAFGLGGLLMHFMMETILAGYLWGLEPIGRRSG